MCGTPQRSRLISTRSAIPSTGSRPRVCGSERRNSCHQRPRALAPASAASAVPSIAKRLANTSDWISVLVRQGLHREPALGLELLEMGLHRERRSRAERLRDVVPHDLEQPTSRALSGREGGEEARLAGAAMLDVLGDLCGRIADPGPV